MSKKKALTVKIPRTVEPPPRAAAKVLPAGVIVKTSGVERAGKKRRPALFELDPRLHSKLAVYCATNDCTQLSVVESALRRFFEVAR